MRLVFKREWRTLYWIRRIFAWDGYVNKPANEDSWDT